MRPDVGVVIVAAGRGTRLGGEPKQFRELGGVPMLQRAMDPFISHPDVSMVAVVVPPESAARPPAWLAEIIGIRVRVVAGGTERHHSVKAGLAVLSEACEIVVVHDGARPFVSAEIIDQTIAIARSGRAAIAALPLSDTVKEAEQSGETVTVRRTVPREELWRAQTPQAFPRVLLERAHAELADFPATDDAQLLEELGHPVVLVPDLSSNIKITTLEDLEIAEALLHLRPASRQPARS